MEKGQWQKRPRRGRFKRRFSLALGIVLALGIAFVVLTKSRLVPYQLSKYINEHMLADSRFTFSCRAITGDLVRRVVLHHPVVRYHGDDASYNVFLADRIAIDYSITGVFRLNLVVQDLSLDNVRLQIRQDAEGRLILPVPVEGEPVASSGAGAARRGAEIQYRRAEHDVRRRRTAAGRQGRESRRIVPVGARCGAATNRPR
jgi:hypothetical protein